MLNELMSGVVQKGEEKRDVMALTVAQMWLQHEQTNWNLCSHYVYSCVPDHSDANVWLT